MQSPVKQAILEELDTYKEEEKNIFFLFFSFFLIFKTEKHLWAKDKRQSLWLNELTNDEQPPNIPNI